VDGVGYPDTAPEPSDFVARVTVPKVIFSLTTADVVIDGFCEVARRFH